MEKLTALQQVMRDIEQHYPNLFDLNTAQGREFVSNFYKYLEIEKEQIIDAYISGYSAPENLGESKKYYNETFSNKGD
jgi:hypothetical protein